jgi:hypothetical protein
MKKNKTLSTEVTPFKKIETSIEKIFGGYLCNLVHCLECGHKNWTCDIFLDLLVNIDKNVVKNMESSYEFEKSYKMGNSNKILNELDNYDSDSNNSLGKLME